MLLKLLTTLAIGLSLVAAQFNCDGESSGYYSAKPPADYLVAPLFASPGCNEAKWPTYILDVRWKHSCRFYGAPGCPQDSLRAAVTGPWGPTTELSVGPGGTNGVTHYTCWCGQSPNPPEGYDEISNTTMIENVNKDADTAVDKAHESSDRST